MVTDLTGSPILAGTTAAYSTTLLDGSGDPVPAASLVSLTLTVYSPYTLTAVAGFDGADGLSYLAATSGVFTLPLPAAATAKTTSLALEELWVHLEWEDTSGNVGGSYAILGLVDD